MGWVDGSTPQSFLTDATAQLTLQELEGDDWGDPGPDDTRLVQTVLGLRRKPLREMVPEDVRILLGQQVSPKHLVPLALDILAQDPWVGGDMSSGALLSAVLRQEPRYWVDHPDHWQALNQIITTLPPDNE